MPPVMGAAAFLMVEYVGIPYAEIIKHAALPAIASYVSLFYIVHLEAVKLGSKPIPREEMAFKTRLLRTGLGLSGMIAIICLLYYGVQATQAVFGASASTVLMLATAAIYVASVWYSSRYDDLVIDDPHAPIIQLPRAWDVVRTGLDFMIPLVVLLWCLTIEQLSPGLSAFWGTAAVMGIVATRKLLLAVFRGGAIASSAVEGWYDLVDGLAAGARNMIGIAVATATAGIVVGTVTLTGLGLMMTEFVEFLSGGNVIIMLLLTAAISLILGLGIPTTANYILVATLMAPVIVELGAQAGLAIPLIAVHLFVFYFGIMADITPPVGLAAFAAAAIAREDPLATGFQGALYSLRTAILPFVFIFNPAMLLIGIEGWWQFAMVITASMIAILLFSAATMNWFVTRSRLWESAALLLICFTLFRPDWWIDRFYPKWTELPAKELVTHAANAPAGARLTMMVEGMNIEGDEIRKTVNVPLGEAGEGRQRLRSSGITVTSLGDKTTISNIAFGSYARRVGLEAGYEVKAVLAPAQRPSQLWPIFGGLLATGLIALLQWRRRESEVKPAPAAAV